MNYLFRYIIILTIVVTVIGCHNPAHRALVEAESIMEADPDSALSIINSIDSGEISSDSERALHALLLTQALVKTNGYPNDDSLINIAVRHYEVHGPDSNLMKSLFYQGQVRYYGRNYPDAIIPSMKAREMAIRLNNPYWHAKASDLIADLFNLTYYHSEAIEYRIDAITQYEKAGKIDNHRFSICDLATGYVDIKEFERGLRLADSIHRIATETGYDALALYSADAAFLCHFKLGDYYAVDSLAKYMQQREYIQPMSTIKKTYASLARMYLGDYTEADSLVNLYNKGGLNINRLLKFFFLTSYYKSIDDANNSRRFQDSASAEQDSVVAGLIRHSVVSRQRDFISDEWVKEHAKSESLRLKVVFVVVIAALIMLIMCMIYRQRMKIKDLTLSRHLDDIYDLTAQMESASALNNQFKEQNSRMSGAMEKMFQDKWRFINELCSKFFDENSNTDKQLLVDKIEEQINNLRNESTIEEIVRTADYYTGGLITSLRKTYPSLKADEINLTALLVSGLTAKTICFFTNMKLKTFYTKRARLIEKIEKSETPIGQQILSLIKN